MSALISGNRTITAHPTTTLFPTPTIDDGATWGTITIESSWPGVNVTISKVTPKDLRAIAAECNRVADLLETAAIAEAA